MSEPAGNPGVWLVTGATGFLGAAVVEQAIERGHIVRCVVRGATDSERVAKLRTALAWRADGAWDRIEVVPGDLAKVNLGLSDPDFFALGQRVSRVVHCGARVNMTLPYASLYETNVRATEELLDLAEVSGAWFGYVGSLAAVAKSVPDEPFELMAPVGGGYAQSKWSADRLVSVAHQEGRVRAVILRPGRVTADSRTARSNPDDLLEHVIRICARLGTAPILETSVRLSPVDWVSRMIVELSTTAESYGRAHHLVSAQRMPWSSVLRILRSAGYALDEMSYRDWRSSVIAAGQDDPQIARVTHSLPPDGLSFDNPREARPVNPARALAGSQPRLPDVELLLEQTITAWQQAGSLSRPTSRPEPAFASRPAHLLRHATTPGRVPQVQIGEGSQAS